MKVKDIGVKSIIETTSAGGIASVASSLFTPTSDGRPALIRRTKKKNNKNPSVYGEGSSSKKDDDKWKKNFDKQSEARLRQKKRRDDQQADEIEEMSTKPEYHNTQVRGSDATPKAKPGRTKHPFKGKLVGEGDMEADREAGIKWVDDPDWKRLHEMNPDMVKDFLEHKVNVSEAVNFTRQHFEVIADMIGSFPGNLKVRYDFMNHAMGILRQINPQFKDNTFATRVKRAASAEQRQEPTDDDKEFDAEFKASSDRIARDAVGDDTTLTPFKYSNKKESIRTERKLSGNEKKNKEHNVKKLKSHKKNFTDQYGKDGESVMYAVATKSAKKGKKYK